MMTIDQILTKLDHYYKEDQLTEVEPFLLSWMPKKSRSMAFIFPSATSFWAFTEASDSLRLHLRSGRTFFF